MEINTYTGVWDKKGLKNCIGTQPTTLLYRI